MSHVHDHSHKVSTKNIKSAFFLNLFFSTAELIGGLWTGSVAIISDSLHDFGDCLSLGVSWYLQKISAKGRDKNFSYGYRRFSVLGALVTSVVLIVGSIFIVVHSIPKLFDAHSPNTEGMILMAIAGITFHGIAAWRLHTGTSLNERAVYLHLLEDILGWTATLIAAITIRFFSLPFLDPLLAIGIAIFILFGVFKNLSRALKILLQGTPEEIKIDVIQTKLRELKGVQDIHDCHAWSMDGQYHILSVHLVVDKGHTLDSLATIKAEAKHILHHLHIDHATIEFETSEEHCESC